MRLVSLKATPMVPWFDSLDKFREVGVYNKGDDGVFVVAEYYGNNEWINEVDPEYIIQESTPKKMVISLPELVQKGQTFNISASYYLDGKYLIYIGDLPVVLSILDCVSEKQISIPISGEFNITSGDVEIDPCKIIVAL